MYEFITKKGLDAIIRPVEESDATGVIKYVKTVFDETDNLSGSSDEFNITVEKEKEIINSQKEASNSGIYLVKINDEIVALANFSGGKRSRMAHFANLGISVKKKYWGQGIGYHLMKELIHNAKEMGIKKINLEVRTDNEAAINLYYKFGFKDIGVNTRGFYLNGKYIDLLIMGLEL